MKLFTYMDHLNGTCKPHEIDTPWEPRWTSSDVALGLCDKDMVGTRKEQPDQQSEPEPLAITSAVLIEAQKQGIDPDDAEAMARLMLRMDPDGFAKRNPTLYLDLMKMQRVEKAAQAAQVASLAELTANRLKGMSTGMILLKFIEGIYAEPVEVRDRIMARMGVDRDALYALIDEMA